MKINTILAKNTVIKEQILKDSAYQEFYKLGVLLKEYNLNQQQVQQVFKQVADGAAKGGNVEKEGDAPVSNRTVLGKGADAASAVSNAFKGVANWIGKTGPVKGIDNIIDEAQTQIMKAAGGDAGKVGQTLEWYRELSKIPGMGLAVKAIVLGLAGLAGSGLGPVGIAAGLTFANKMLQGNKFSSAVMNAMVTGGTVEAMHVAKGLLVNNEWDNPADNSVDPLGNDQIQNVTSLPANKLQTPADINNPTDAAYTNQMDRASDIANAQGTTPAADYDFDAHSHDYTVKKGDNLSTILDKNKVNPELAAKLNPDIFGPNGNPNLIRPGDHIRLPNKDALDDMNNLVHIGQAGGGYHGQYEPGNPYSLDATHIQKQMDAGKYGPDNGINATKKLQTQSYVNPNQMIQETAAMYYIDRETTARRWVLNEQMGRARGGVYLTNEGVQAIFKEVARRSSIVNEGPMLDKLKGFNKKAGEWMNKAGKKIGDVAGTFTNKITYRDLDLNWRRSAKLAKEDSVDSEQLIKFLKDQGVKTPLINASFKALGLGAQPQSMMQPGFQGSMSAGMTPQSAQALASKAAGQIKKSNATKSTTAADAPEQSTADKQAAGAFGQMANTMAGGSTAVADTMRVGGQTWQKVGGTGNAGDLKYYNPQTREVKSIDDLQAMQKSAPAQGVGRNGAQPQQPAANPFGGLGQRAIAPTPTANYGGQSSYANQNMSFNGKPVTGSVPNIPKVPKPEKEKQTASKINRGTPVTEMRKDFSALLLDKMK